MDVRLHPPAGLLGSRRPLCSKRACPKARPLEALRTLLVEVQVGGDPGSQRARGHAPGPSRAVDDDFTRGCDIDHDRHSCCRHEKKKHPIR